MTVRDLLANRYRAVRRTWQYYREEASLAGHAPRGHHYSPLPDLQEGATHAAREAVRCTEEGLTGVELNTAAQQELLLRMCELYPEFDWPEQQGTERRFHFNQGYYNRADSICLYSMLRLFKPRRIVEVGSGFSSALMLDVNERFLNGETQLTFIEPFPDRLESILRPSDRALTKIIKRRVQDAPTEIFDALTAGDFLFIDSSHVAKVGSDVNYLFREVIPRLAVGTFVHVHDVFWPFEYPADWIREGQAWNEAYMLRAFLSFNESFEIVFWAPLAAKLWPETIRHRMPSYLLNTGAAMWIRRVR